MTNTQFKRVFFDRIVVTFFVVVTFFSSTSAPAFAVLYQPGETNNPACLPTEVNCDVDPSAFMAGVTIGTNSPASTTNTLYNSSGTLYWNGSPAVGMSSLNDLVALTQTIAVGTAGTDFNVSSSGSTHTFNLPNASETIRGLLTFGDWTMFNNKLDKALNNGLLWIGNASNIATPVALSGDATVSNAGVVTLSNSGVISGSYGSAVNIPIVTVDTKGRLTAASTTPTNSIAIAGDVSGTLGAISVDKLKNAPINLTALTNNDLLQYSGANWINITPASLGSIALGVGSTGTDINTSGSPASLGGTLTINIPDASETARGVISTGAQTIAGGKTFSGPTTLNGGGTVTNASGLLLNPYGTSAGNTTELRFGELAANGANYAGFKAPDSLTANILWTLPTVGGAAGAQLTTDAVGNLSWTAAEGDTNFSFTGPHTGNSFELNDITAIGTGFKQNYNSLTSGSGQNIVSTANALTGNLLDITLSGNNAANTGNVLSLISSGAASLAKVLNVDVASTGSPTNGFVRFNFSGAHTGSGFEVNDNTSTGTVMQVLANNVTTGNGMYISANSLSEGGAGLSISNAVSEGNTYDLIRLQGGSNTGSAFADFMKFRRPDGTVIGSINQTSGFTIAYYTSSDSRLKTDTGNEVKGLSDLLSVPVHNFQWNGTNEVQDGFFAQELHKIYPQAVKVGTDEVDENGRLKNPWQVDYGRVTPLLVKSIQDQQLEIAGLTGTSSIVFASTSDTILSMADANSVTDVVAYITNKIAGGVKIVHELVAERVVAINGYFKRIFANELCLMDSTGQQVCITGNQLTHMIGNTETHVTQSNISTSGESEVVITPSPVADTSSDEPALIVAIEPELLIEIPAPEVEPSSVLTTEPTS